MVGFSGLFYLSNLENKLPTKKGVFLQRDGKTKAARVFLCLSTFSLLWLVYLSTSRVASLMNEVTGKREGRLKRSSFETKIKALVLLLRREF